MQSATAASLIQRARYAADAETPTPSTDFVSDTEALTYLTTAYRKLIDWIVDNGGQDLLLVNATLTPPTYDLPADYYRVAMVQVPVIGSTPANWFTLRRFNLAEMNRRVTWETQYPLWRIINGQLRFDPENAQPTSVRLWYIPDVDDVQSGDVLQTFGGWDEYIFRFMAVEFLNKEERDASAQTALWVDARDQVARAVKDQATVSNETVARVEFLPAQYRDHYGPFIWRR